jgi:sec-independent protein translocase protein TatC
MTFGEHLEELRTALFKALAGLVVGAILGFFVADYVVALLQAPLQEALKKYYTEKSETTYAAVQEELKADGKQPLPYTDEELTAMMLEHALLFEVEYVHPSVFAKRLGLKADEPAEGFSIWLKAGLVAGAIISSPWIFYQIWSFVAAGLYPHERRYIHVFLPFSLFLFLLGAATAYLFVFGPVLTFLFNFNKSMNIDPDLRISELISFVLVLPLGFGISFQLPLVMLFLERIGVFDIRMYIEKWRIAVLVIIVLSAILTPADPYSLFLMATPLCFLYYGGILLCRMMPRKTMV